MPPSSPARRIVISHAGDGGNGAPGGGGGGGGGDSDGDDSSSIEILCVRRPGDPSPNPNPAAAAIAAIAAPRPLLLRPPDCIEVPTAATAPPPPPPSAVEEEEEEATARNETKKEAGAGEDRGAASATPPLLPPSAAESSASSSLSSPASSSARSLLRDGSDKPGPPLPPVMAPAPAPADAPPASSSSSSSPSPPPLDKEDDRLAAAEPPANSASAASPPAPPRARPPTSPPSPRTSPPLPPMSTCWKCEIGLEPPYFVEHEHPALLVPVCAACRDELEAVDAGFRDDDRDQAELPVEEPEECSGCGPSPEGGVELLLCDSCPRGFCFECVRRARTGGEAGEAGPRSDQEAPGGGPWRCPGCDPPPPLRRLQDDFRARRGGSEGSSSSGEEDEAEEASELNDAALQAKYEKWRDELAACEDEMEDVLQDLDDGEDQDDDDSSSASGARYYLLRRHAALGDRIARLQEALESTCGVDLAALYDRVLGRGRADGEDPLEALRGIDPAAADGGVPAHVLQALQAAGAIARRRRQELPVFVELDGDGPDKYVDVEDLDEAGGGESALRRTAAVEDPANGWRQASQAIDPEVIRAYKEQEDALLASLRVPVRRATERGDRRATRTEERDERRRGRRRGPPRAAGKPGGKRAESRQQLRAGDSSDARLDGDESPAPKEPAEGAAEETPADAEVLEPRSSTADTAPSQVPENPEAVPAKPKKRVVPLLVEPPAPAAAAEPPPAGAQDAPPSSPAAAAAARPESPGSCSFLPPRSGHKRRRGCEFSGPDAFVVNPGAERQVTVAAGISARLKQQQKEGLQFIWRNSFSDVNKFRVAGEAHGCILAHHMGLGKTLTAIALLHTALAHPSLDTIRGKLFRKAVIVAPVNTLSNWSQEVNKWTRHLGSRLFVDDLSGMGKSERSKAIERWTSQGGILLLGEQLLHRLTAEADSKAKGERSKKGDKKVEDDLFKTDILVLDEAHTMLKNSGNKVFQALAGVETRRRILLTGTPLTNNVTEYFRMVHFACPGAIHGITTESEFEKQYRIPIELGLPSDARTALREASVSAQVRLRNVLEPIVHRRGALFLRKDGLPHMQQVVLHLRQTRAQTRLCRQYKRLQRGDAARRSFFRMWHETKKVHNHPGILTIPQPYPSSRSKSPVPEDDEDGDADSYSTWWKPFVRNAESLKDVENGYKMVVLLHILEYSKAIDDKVLVFSTCLRTLDYIESVLQLPKWKSLVPSLEDDSIGAYKKNEEYVRIDGSVGSGERGEIVTQFNDEDTGKARVFLISSRAGGIGINLTAANRVVLFDSSFNPTIATQCIYRAYRYGQKKEVFCYRLLTEGTMETKIYARSVTKQGVSYRVVDGKSFQRCFAAHELEDMQEFNDWVQCDRCEKWRMFSKQTDQILPDKWYCEMNDDVENNSCQHEERDQFWYENRRQSARADGDADQANLQSDIETNPGDELTEEQKNELLSKDELLQRILDIKQEKKNTAIVSRYEFHEALLDADDKANESEPKLSVGADTKGHALSKASPSSPTQAGDADAAAEPQSASRPTKKSAPSTPKSLTPPVRTTPARLAKSTPRQQTLEEALKHSTAHSKLLSGGHLEGKKRPASKKKTKPYACVISVADREGERSSGTTPALAGSGDSVTSAAAKRRRMAGKRPPAHVPDGKEVIDLCDSDAD